MFKPNMEAINKLVEENRTKAPADRICFCATCKPELYEVKPCPCGVEHGEFFHAEEKALSEYYAGGYEGEEY